MKKIFIVTDEDGNIIGTSAIIEETSDLNEQQDNSLITGLRALPGQLIYFLELPEEYARCSSTLEKYNWLSKHKVTLDPKPHLIEKAFISVD